MLRIRTSTILFAGNGKTKGQEVNFKLIRLGIGLESVIRNMSVRSSCCSLPSPTRIIQSYKLSPSAPTPPTNLGTRSAVWARSGSATLARSGTSLVVGGGNSQWQALFVEGSRRYFATREYKKVMKEDKTEGRLMSYTTTMGRKVFYREDPRKRWWNTPAPRWVQRIYYRNPYAFTLGIIAILCIIYSWPLVYGTYMAIVTDPDELAILASESKIEYYNRWRYGIGFSIPFFGKKQSPEEKKLGAELYEKDRELRKLEQELEEQYKTTNK